MSNSFSTEFIQNSRTFKLLAFLISSENRLCLFLYIYLMLLQYTVLLLYYTFLFFFFFLSMFVYLVVLNCLLVFKFVSKQIGISITNIKLFLVKTTRWRLLFLARLRMKTFIKNAKISGGKFFNLLLPTF